MRLLILGPRHHKSGKVGGVVVSFGFLLEELEKRGISFVVIDINKRNYPSTFVGVIAIYLQLLRHVFFVSNITLHGTANDYKYIAPIVVFVSNMLGKRVSLRKFAGSFIEHYERSIFPVKWLIGFALRRSDAIFFETKYLVRYFKRFNENTYWMPNSRPIPDKKRDNRPFQKRFVFLGHVCKEKGILELLAAADRLGEQYKIDIYGNMVDRLEKQIEQSNVEYKGILKPNEVTDTLVHYDVLVLPSFWEGEGYSGVIIEALSVGLPVVASSLKGVREIITDGESGLLIEPKNVEQLVEAMGSFNTKNYPVFSKKALERFEAFDIKNITTDFLERTGYGH